MTPADRIRVLITDDSAFMRQILADTLTSVPDITVVGRARNGTDALHKTLVLEPDVITMDINMPEMDGFETTRQIRALEGDSGERIPIVAFTANVLPVFKERCLGAGMDDFLTKPFRREDIFAAVKKWVV